MFVCPRLRDSGRLFPGCRYQAETGSLGDRRAFRQARMECMAPRPVQKRRLLQRVRSTQFRWCAMGALAEPGSRDPLVSGLCASKAQLQALASRDQSCVFDAWIEKGVDHVGDDAHKSDANCGEE